MEDEELSPFGAFMTAFFNVASLAILYGIAFFFWALAIRHGFHWYILALCIFTVLLILLVGVPTARQKTRKQIRAVSDSVGMLLMPPALWIGILGLVFWLVRILFFR